MQEIILWLLGSLFVGCTIIILIDDVLAPRRQAKARQRSYDQYHQWNRDASIKRDIR